MTFVYLIIFLYSLCTTADSAVRKRQVKIGQFLFPRTATFPDDGWNSVTYENAEPIYDEIILLPQERKLNNVEQVVENNKQTETNRNAPNHRIGSKSRKSFAQSRILLGKKQLSQSKQPVFQRIGHPSTFRQNSSDSEEMIQILSDNTRNFMDLYHGEISNDKTEDPYQIPLNTENDISDSKNVVSAKAEFGGKVVIDMRGNNSKKRQSFPSNSDENKHDERETTSSSENIDDNSVSAEHFKQQRRHVRRIHPSKKLNEDIYGSIQLVRRDIHGIKNDLLEVKEIVSEIHRKQNQTRRRIDLEDSADHDEAFDLNHSNRGHPEMSENITGNSSTELKTLPVLLLTSEMTGHPLTTTTLIDKASNHDQTRWNNSEHLKLSELANLTVETAHQVFPILLQSSQNTQLFNHSTLPTSIHHEKPPILIAADTSHSRFIHNNGYETSKYGTLIRRDDEEIKKLRQKISQENKIFHDGLERKDDEKIVETRWPFDVDGNDFSIDSTADTIHPEIEETIKLLEGDSQIPKSNIFPEPFRQTLLISTPSIDATKTNVTIRPYTSSMSTTTTTTDPLIMKKNNVTSMSHATFEANLANSESEITFEAPGSPGSTTLTMERYTYEDPDSLLSDEGIQQTIHPLIDEMNYAIYEIRSTQQSPLWPDVLFQGG